MALHVPAALLVGAECRDGRDTSRSACAGNRRAAGRRVRTMTFGGWIFEVGDGRIKPGATIST